VSTTLENRLSELLNDEGHALNPGLPPTEAIIRTARRRRARLRTVPAALVTAGAVALGGWLAGTNHHPQLSGDGEPSLVAPLTIPAKPLHLRKGTVFTLAEYTGGRLPWKVTASLWRAPRTRAEADLQRKELSRDPGVESGQLRAIAPGVTWMDLELSTTDKFAQGSVGPIKPNDKWTEVLSVSHGMWNYKELRPSPQPNLHAAMVQPEVRRVEIELSNGDTVEPRLIRIPGVAYSWYSLIVPKDVRIKSTTVEDAKGRTHSETH
jgi:hypothetical protein